MKTPPRLLFLFTLLSAAVHAEGIVHLPAPSGGYENPGDPADGITFGSSYFITPGEYGLYISAPWTEFSGGIGLGAGSLSGTVDGIGIIGGVITIRSNAIEFTNFSETSRVILSVSENANDPTLQISDGLQATHHVRVGPWWDASAANVELGSDGSATAHLAFGIGGSYDTFLRRGSLGVLTVNGQNIVTQNGLANYVTLGGAQTLTNKSIDAGQLTGNLAVAKGGTGLTSYTAGDLLYATGASTLGKLSPASAGNVLLSGSSPSWGKVGLTTHVSGTLPVANGGTGTTSLTGILKGNGTSAVTTVAAPAGALVGTTDTQTLSNKTLSNPTVAGTLNGDANGLNLSAPPDKNMTLSASGDGMIILNGWVSAPDGLISYAMQTNWIDFSGQGLSDTIEYIDGQSLWIGTRYALELHGGDGIRLYSDTTVEGEFTAGYGNTAAGFAAAAFGEQTQASMDNSVAFGFGSHASGVSSVAAGDSVQAKGYASLAAGEATIAKAYNSVALGRMNVEQGDQHTWVAGDELVTVGNGDPNTDAPVRSNALSLQKNGNLRVAGVIDAKQGIRTAPMGDIGMGDFTAGANPAALNPGLRYATE